MVDEKDIWAERLKNREYIAQKPDPFILDWIKRLSKKGAKALDVGCGWGRHIRPLCASGFEVVGLDTSIGMLAAARSNLSSAGFEAEFVEADATQIPFPAESFDLVIATRAIHHGDRRFMVRCLNEIERVLMSDGHLIASFPSVNDWRYGEGISVEIGTFVPDLDQEEGGILHHYTNADEMLGWLKKYEIVGWEEILKPYIPKMERRGSLDLCVDSIRDVSFEADSPDGPGEQKHWATYFVAAKKKSPDDTSL